MLRAVVDVNVLVSAVLTPGGSPHRVLEEWLGCAFELVASPTLLAESRQVLSRPTIAAKAETQLRTTLMTTLASDALLVDDPATQDPVVVRDSSDDYLVALGRAAGAQVIVTGDGHLLDLPALEPPALEPRRFVSLLERTG